MKSIVVAILSIFLSISAFAQESAMKKELLAPFTTVEIDAPIRLKLIKIAENEIPYILYDTKGATLSRFSFEVNNKTRTLKITERYDPQRKTTTEVEVYFNTITDLSIARADATIEGTLKSQLLDIYVSHSAHLVAEIDVLDVMVYASGKSRIELKGEAHYHTADISTALYDAHNLRATSTIVESSHNAVARVDAEDRLQMKTSTGGKIYYRSQPVILRSNITTFGGEITVSK
ncbi:MAG: DUF2807 domain-containing protein [Alistipes sp.]|nr:DUF2807 domain-containing protein [Alistipes sp.]